MTLIDKNRNHVFSFLQNQKVSFNLYNILQLIFKNLTELYRLQSLNVFINI